MRGAETMKIRVVLDREGQAIAAVSLEPNPDGALIEPVLEEGQRFEDLDAAVTEMHDPAALFERYSQRK
jgi:hypothetical protein